VVVPINARYRGEEIAYLAGNADLVTIVTTGQVTEGLNFVQRLLEGLPGLASCTDARALALEDTPRLRNVLVLGAGAVAALTSEADIAAAAAQVEESAIASRIDAVGRHQSQI
jgi:fatty-acyl-CoA synthase